MGNLNNFSIYFANTAIYITGHMVNGRDSVVIAEHIKMRALRLKAHDRAHTEWKETRIHQVHDSSQTHEETIEFCSQILDSVYYNQSCRLES